MRGAYHFIVCGSGSSGSVVARRLAEDPAVNVLLLEAGGSDDCPSVLEPGLWPTNLASERDWAFLAEPNPNRNGRVLPMSMGNVLGGGSSINVMVWARGHRTDWDHFAAEAGDAGGVTNPSWRSVGGAKTGAEHRTPPTAASVDSFTFNPRLTLVRSRLGVAQWEIKWITDLYGSALPSIDLTEERWVQERVGQVVKRYVPLGVVCAISPWNLPFMLSTADGANSSVDAMSQFSRPLRQPGSLSLGVMPYAVDPEAGDRLWSLSERTSGPSPSPGLPRINTVAVVA